jgi:hypothetical protein
MYEHEKLRSAKNRGARKKNNKNHAVRKIKERESANAKAQNLRPKKERKSASGKSSAQEREITRAKRKKKRVPSSAVAYAHSIKGKAPNQFITRFFFFDISLRSQLRKLVV